MPGELQNVGVMVPQRQTNAPTSTATTATTNDHGDDGDDETSWVGNNIKAPAGGRGRATNERGRLGDKNDDIHRALGITPQKWDLFLVSDIDIPFRTILFIRYSLLHTG